MALAVNDANVAVAQVQGVGQALVTVADDGNGLGGEHGKVGIRCVIDRK